MSLYQTLDSASFRRIPIHTFKTSSFHGDHVNRYNIFTKTNYLSPEHYLTFYAFTKLAIKFVKRVVLVKIAK